VTEVPEHLLKKAAEARARLSGQAPPDAGESAAPSSESAADAAPVPATTAAPAPAVPEEPAAPEPAAPSVQAAETRHKVPVWLVPGLVFPPFWPIFYARADPLRPRAISISNWLQKSQPTQSHCWP